MRRRLSLTLRVAVATALAVVGLPAIIEAIFVSPTAVFIHDRTRATQVTIGNAGDTPEEATVELKFGFLDADSAGTPFVRFVEDPGPEFPSAADWVRAFPQRVRLAPKTQQVVRLMARPPDSLPDGEYWTRMIITGRGASMRVAGGDSAVRAAVNLEIRLVTSVTYRKGRVSTGVVVRGINVEAEGDSLTVWARLAREGNAAYHGTTDVEVVNAAGAVVRHWSAAVSVFVPLTRRFSFPLDSLTPGDYKVRFRVRAERPDLPADKVLPAPTVTDSAVVRVG